MLIGGIFLGLLLGLLAGGSLANLASMALPVSNLTTLIASQQWSVGAVEVFLHVGIPTVVASIAVGQRSDAMVPDRQGLGMARRPADWS